MVTLKHNFVSGKADGSDATLVKPTDWNAEHKFETTAEGVYLGRSTGAGPGVVQELPIGSVFLPGMMMVYGGAAAPAGWLLCQGQLLVRAEYTALVAVIGGTYNIGGETAAQFRLPDIRGRVVAGVDAGAGRIGTIVSGVLGGAGGTETYALTVAEMPSHGHGDSGHGHGITDPWHAHGSRSYNYGLGGTGSDSVMQDALALSGNWGYDVEARATGITISTGYANIQPNGSGVAHRLMQPTLVTNYIIKT